MTTSLPPQEGSNGLVNTSNTTNNGEGVLSSSALSAAYNVISKGNMNGKRNFGTYDSDSESDDSLCSLPENDIDLAQDDTLLSMHLTPVVIDSVLDIRNIDFDTEDTSNFSTLMDDIWYDRMLKRRKSRRDRDEAMTERDSSLFLGAPVPVPLGP